MFKTVNEAKQCACHLREFDCQCLADKCMHWRFSCRLITREHKKVGYCGLSGKPEDPTTSPNRFIDA